MQARAGGFRWVRIPKKGAPTTAIGGSTPIPEFGSLQPSDGKTVSLPESLEAINQSLLEFNQASGLEIDDESLLALCLEFTEAALGQDGFRLIQIPHTMSTYGTPFVTNVFKFTQIDPYCAPINALD